MPTRKLIDILEHLKTQNLDSQAHRDFDFLKWTRRDFRELCERKNRTQ